MPSCSGGGVWRSNETWNEPRVSTAPRSHVCASVIEDSDWVKRTSNSLLFTDPKEMAEHMAVLRDAGVRNVVPWMGVGGVAREHVLRSMRPFAEQVMPKFAD